MVTKFTRATADAEFPENAGPQDPPRPCVSSDRGLRTRRASPRSRTPPRQEKGSAARSSAAEGVLPFRGDPHLPGDLGVAGVDDDDVSLPVLRRLVSAPRTLVLVADERTVPARLRNLHRQRHRLRFG